MMVDLLARSTSMEVRQAAEGMPIEPDYLYVIPPGTYLSVGAGMLHLSPPQARHGARLPFDFLLHSLALDLGSRAVCVVLSGTGADGSLGLKAVKESGGFVIAQDPEEAGYPGMPRNAITSGAVDLVLSAAEIPDALRRLHVIHDTKAPAESRDRLAEIIELLRVNTAHDFRLYKPGTLQRRIERRMGMASVDTNDMERYIQKLRADAGELALLAKDLLINVTNFFRDPQVFETLAEKIIPEIVRSHAPDRPIRIWVAGCSTGEETYSLAILFREEIAAAKLGIKLQIFASDVDPDAVTIAREGLYPQTIEGDVSAERIARFFAKEDDHYRISAELRAAVVFTVQDVLADPPFSRLDFVSCRNLLIYLRPEAQAKVLALFHFALEQGGILLLGTSETVDDPNGHFEVVSKSDRIYRQTGRGRAGEFAFIRTVNDGARVAVRPGQTQAPSRQAALAELCRRMVIEAYAPAAVLVNRRNEWLYSLGPTDRYLRVVPGAPSFDLLAMARQGIRTKLRSAIHKALQENARVVTAGGQVKEAGSSASFSISVQPIRHDGEDLLLVCFENDPKPGIARERPAITGDALAVSELEKELEATRTELQGAIHNLEISGEEQKAINEEALSVQEEYQSTNEELLTSKEELQSLNEELTALNSQLQETLERQRTTSNDLQNVLYSTDVATLFLDRKLAIRFFTPATKALFSIIPSDLGRPLSDLSSLAADADLLTDAKTVLRSLEPIEREIEAQNGACYIRRVLPYRTQDNGVEGVVITFADITDRRQVSDELSVAKRQAELANAAKSRFLAAASHDLRQPLQTLALVQGLLAKNVESEKARKLVSRLDQTLGAMSGMLNALLDINQIETGTVHAEVTTFAVNDLLDQLRDEFSYHAQAKGLVLRVVPCTLSIRSDPRLLEQMIRNLLANGLKYTRRGSVLLGCRRHQGTLTLEVWDTGIGIAADEIDAIFEEYHQIDNAARERSRGLGLGLSIVQRLGVLLDHPVRVRSWPDKGSVFSIDVPLTAVRAIVPRERRLAGAQDEPSQDVHHTGTILVIEDDPDVRELLEAFLKDDGHAVTTASDGIIALDLVKRGVVGPDLILADYNLPTGMDGVRATILLREAMQRPVPAIILTGDISTGTLNSIALEDCIHLSKPMKLKELTQAVQRLLPLSGVATRVRVPRLAESQNGASPPVIFVVDDDDGIRQAIRGVLEDDGRAVEDFATCESFLEAFQPGREACLVVDAYLPGMSGLGLLRHLHDAGHRLPSVMITGSSDVPMAVQAMKAGASDFIEKPISRGELLACVDRALDQARDSGKLSAWRKDAANHVAGLTVRQRQVMEMVLAGHPSKNIAADLGISQRTVENHRASIMQKMGTRSLPALARLALAAERAPAAFGDPELPSAPVPTA
ncbi:MAG: two-component system, chemotaxis family, CheB/CheR fusion protein [Acetobacteraceae bacterium]|nr:two-component system, chemotaxis family, CheB/CheR fusion protein [Acetobacteraceae bacterium]